MNPWFVRLGLLLGCVALGLGLRPLGFLGEAWAGLAPSLAAGVAVALLAFAVERAIRVWEIWQTAGAAVGLLVGGLLGAVLVRLLPDTLGGTSAAGLRPFVYLVALYGGGIGGARLAASFRDEDVLGRLTREGGAGTTKVLDTSVIIDGRIADLAETGFLDGVLVVPNFVLRELQYVSDSPEPTRRARGRRGLETLQRIKKNGAVRVIFSDEEIPDAREVDQKLIELSSRMRAKLVTLDYNLNKVASLRGIEVLNIHDLANALRPVVLPGEMLRLTVLREGKEPGQGVAYLDDGTMVVVDQGREKIGRTLQVVVTSVIQTTAGKMLFARPSGVEANAPAAPGRTEPQGPAS